MAINLGNVKVADLWENAHKALGIGINRTSDTAGAFPVNYATIKQAKDNLVNLLLTKKGERLHQPDFGCDIWKVLFEPIIDGTIDTEIERTIIEAVSIWLPYLTVEELVVDYSDVDIDNHNVNIEIVFSLADNRNITDSVTINVNNQ
jgi:phage baseplate assembly protein W